MKILLTVIAIIFLPLLIVIVILYYLWSAILAISIWILWGTRGRYILFVYSDSPIWSGYIKQEILPRITNNAIILNWSERKKWGSSLAVLAFKHFGGYRNFNPLALIFRPFHFNKEFRFYEAFKDFKHNKTEKLEHMKTDFFKAIDQNQKR